MADVAMPRLSDSMEEGTILKWLVSDGDPVSKGDEIAEIETDKANMTFEADQDGTLTIVAQEGATLSVGETIAKIGEGGEGEADDESGDDDEAKAEGDDDSGGDADDDDSGGDEPKAEGDEDSGEGDSADEDAAGDSEAEGDDDSEGGDDTEAEGGDAAADDAADAEGDDDAAAQAGSAETQSGGGDAVEDSGGGNGRVKASPIARRMARDIGLELAGVKGTGPGGRIVKADVEAAAKGGEAPPEEAPPEEAPAKEQAPEKQVAPAGDGQSGRGDVTHQDLTRLQRTVARRMAESKATAPDFVITVEVDMEEAVELRKQLKVASGDRPAPSFNDLVIKAAALTLRDFPRANGAYRDGAFELYSRVNVGVAVAGQDALVVPTVFDADKKSLGTIAAESRELAERVRDGKITPPELSAGTFTISNLGMYGIRRFVAVINPPQAAILAVGELTPLPVVRDGEIVVRHMMELTLSCDHRILYGADAAQFLARIREYLQMPLRLTL